MHTSIPVLAVLSQVIRLVHEAKPQVSTPLLLSYGLIVMIFTGIALPAVWSRRPARRKAAAEVLDRLLRFMRPRS